MARSPGPTATRASSSAPGSAPTSTGCTPSPRRAPDAAQNPVQYPFRSFDGGSLIDRQRSGTRVYDINTDGVDHYGLYPDWIEDLRMVAGQQIVDDMANGAEAYLQNVGPRRGRGALAKPSSNCRSFASFAAGEPMKECGLRSLRDA